CLPLDLLAGLEAGDADLTQLAEVPGERCGVAQLGPQLRGRLDQGALHLRGDHRPPIRAICCYSSRPGRYAAERAGRPATGEPARSPRSCSSSASWTALVAAPLRKLSETIHTSSARSWPGSRRIRPTNTSSRPAASIASG